MPTWEEKTVPQAQSALGAASKLACAAPTVGRGVLPPLRSMHRSAGLRQAQARGQGAVAAPPCRDDRDRTHPRIRRAPWQNPSSPPGRCPQLLQVFEDETCAFLTSGRSPLNSLREIAKAQFGRKWELVIREELP